MTTQEAKDLFEGSARKLAEAIGVSVQAIHQWGDEVPELRVYQIKEVARQKAA